jgi:hypothetical protein
MELSLICQPLDVRESVNVCAQGKVKKENQVQTDNWSLLETATVHTQTSQVSSVKDTNFPSPNIKRRLCLVLRKCVCPAIPEEYS